MKILEKTEPFPVSTWFIPGAPIRGGLGRAIDPLPQEKRKKKEKEKEEKKKEEKKKRKKKKPKEKIMIDCIIYS